MHATERNESAEAGLAQRTIRYGKWGIRIGGVLCILPILSYVLFGNRGFNELHTSLPKVLALYIVGGCIAGALVGVVMPIIRSAFMAGVVGSVIGTIGGCAINIMDPTVNAWAKDEIVISILFGIALGGTLGVAYHRSSNDSSKTA